jgi:L-amino acid N-acyltransferase YncA
MSDITRNVKLPDGAQVVIRPMTADDRDAVLEFARNLPEEDLLFLRVDLTQPEVVDDWIRNIEAGDSSSLAAHDDDGFIGYATVHRNTARWTRRVGEIRVNVAPEYRARGLGRVLTNEIFDLARELGLKKLIANMTTDQRAAQGAFGRLGFVAAALLTDFVEDSAGKSRDLVIMSYDMDGHSEQADDRVRI